MLPLTAVIAIFSKKEKKKRIGSKNGHVMLWNPLFKNNLFPLQVAQCCSQTAGITVAPQHQGPWFDPQHGLLPGRNLACLTVGFLSGFSSFLPHSQTCQQVTCRNTILHLSVNESMKVSVLYVLCIPASCSVYSGLVPNHLLTIHYPLSND